MVARRSGRVVNVVSSGGVGDPHPYSTSCASSKSGLMRLTEGLAKETEEHGVKVFAVGPPAVLTEMTKFIMKDTGGKTWRPDFPRYMADGNDFKPHNNDVGELSTPDNVTERIHLFSENREFLIGRRWRIFHRRRLHQLETRPLVYRDELNAGMEALDPHPLRLFVEAQHRQIGYDFVRTGIGG